MRCVQSGVLFLCLTIVLAVEAHPRAQHGWMVPQSDGTLKYWSQADAVKFEASMERKHSDDKPIIYNLFTRRNPIEPQILVADDKEALAKSYFNKDNPTRFMIHGWLIGNYSSGARTLIVDAYLNTTADDDFNVFVVDWSFYAQNVNYAESRYDAPVAGREIAEFVDFLHENAGMSFETLTLIGHSLGGHVIGFVGKNVKNGRVNSLIGLDPAGPLFTFSKPANRLSETDADYVETIHTDGGELGYMKPLGHASFYPNWGKHQPGCKYDVGGECSHARAILLFSEAIQLRERNQFVPVECSSYDSIKSRENCNGLVNGIRMGDPENFGRANGIYYLPTNGDAPFGMGL